MMKYSWSSFKLSNIALLACVALSACSNTLVEDTSRAVAKNAVNNIVAAQFPGANVSRYTDCIIDNASSDEIFSIARDATANNTGGVTETVFEIAKRPDPANCLQRQLVGGLLG